MCVCIYIVCWNHCELLQPSVDLTTVATKCLRYRNCGTGNPYFSILTMGYLLDLSNIIEIIKTNFIWNSHEHNTISSSIINTLSSAAPNKDLFTHDMLAENNIIWEPWVHRMLIFVEFVITVALSLEINLHLPFLKPQLNLSPFRLKLVLLK